MTPGSDPLAALRDIRLPADPSWWPPAPGWWALALLAMLAAALLTRAVGRRRRIAAPSKQARRLLEEIESRYRLDNDEARALRELSVLLRRYLLARFPREEVAGRHGGKLADFLVVRFSLPPESRVELDHLLELPYRPDARGVGRFAQLVRTVIDARCPFPSATRTPSEPADT